MNNKILCLKMIDMFILLTIPIISFQNVNYLSEGRLEFSLYLF